MGSTARVAAKAVRESRRAAATVAAAARCASEARAGAINYHQIILYDIIVPAWLRTASSADPARRALRYLPVAGRVGCVTHVDVDVLYV